MGYMPTVGLGPQNKQLQVLNIFIGELIFCPCICCFPNWLHEPLFQFVVFLIFVVFLDNYFVHIIYYIINRLIMKKSYA
jgi:hypothetical protein